MSAQGDCDLVTGQRSSWKLLGRPFNPEAQKGGAWRVTGPLQIGLGDPIAKPRLPYASTQFKWMNSAPFFTNWEAKGPQKALKNLKVALLFGFCFLGVC